MVNYDAQAALIVVDVQNDFADPQGSLSVPGGADVVPFANAERAAAEAGGAFIAFSQDWHPKETPHFATFGGIWPEHCIAGTWGAEFAPGLDVRGHIVRKGSNGEDGYSAFSMRDPVSGETVPTELGGMLSERGITRVVVIGLATDYCVNATALDAIAAGLEVTVLREGVRAVDLEPGDGDRALAEIEAAGGVIL